MTWDGMKKALSRAGTTVMQKTGQVDRTVDSSFSAEEMKFKSMEKDVIQLHKSAKLYLDSIRGMAAAEARLADVITQFYSLDNTTSTENVLAAQAYKRALDDLDRTTASDLETPYRQTVLEPIGKLNSYMPAISAVITKREHKAKDYDSARHTLTKLSAKGAMEDPGKLSRAQAEHDQAQDIFNDINGALIRDLPRFVDLRVSYLDPSFEAMVKIQTSYATNSYEKLVEVQRYFGSTVRDDYAHGQLDAQVENILAEMRELSISGMA